MNDVDRPQARSQCLCIEVDRTVRLIDTVRNELSPANNGRERYAEPGCKSRRKQIFPVLPYSKWMREDNSFSDNVEVERFVKKLVYDCEGKIFNPIAIAHSGQIVGGRQCADGNRNCGGRELSPIDDGRVDMPSLDGEYINLNCLKEGSIEQQVKRPVITGCDRREIAFPGRCRKT